MPRKDVQDLQHSGSSRELPRSQIGKHWRELREVKKINGTVLAFLKKIISQYIMFKSVEQRYHHMDSAIDMVILSVTAVGIGASVVLRILLEVNRGVKTHPE
jgi:hypothetical protein